jgi:methylated-DNA-[protein]-cysteine S-methyltransferase
MDTLIASRPLTLNLQRIASPVGRVELASNGSAVTSVTIGRDGVPEVADSDIESSMLLDDAAAQLLDYFDGSCRGFSVPIALYGTPFQQAVWQQLSLLSWGEFTTYGTLASAIGRSGSGRAVGRAIGANPTPLLIGCHRVLSASGGITGYSQGQGVSTKLWLLDHERIIHR